MTGSKDGGSTQAGGTATADGAAKVSGSPRARGTRRRMPGVLGNPTVQFVLRRLGYSAIVLLGVIIVVFAMMQLVPGDPIRVALGTRFTQEAYDALLARSGLDRPLIVQFFSYLGGVLTGDLGVSFRSGQSVTSMLVQRLPATISLAVVAIVVALVIAVPAGIYSALKEGRASDAIVRVTSQFGVSLPDFWLGVLLIMLFSAILGWLPSSGYTPLLEDPVDWARHVILPGATSGLVAAAIITRYIRSAVLEVKSSGYVRTARSKGLAPRIVLSRHIVRNAMIPILTITGIQLATILSGLMVVEVVFAWPGLGRLIYDSVEARDYPVVQGGVLLVAALFLLVNFVVDVLYAVVDPRIRLS